METETKTETQTKEIVQRVEDAEVVDAADSDASAKAKAEELSKIEGQLADAWKQEVKLWVQTYLLMRHVEDEQLYEAKGYASYTAWVTTLATKILGVHPSLLWKRLKAGRAYAAHILREASAADSDADANVMNEQQKHELVEKRLTETNLSPDSLVYIDKIAKGHPEMADELIEKAESGELHNSDLRDAWKKAKEEQAEKRAERALKKASEKASASLDDDVDGNDEANTSTTDIHVPPNKAQHIVVALKDGHGLWMQKLYRYSEKQETPQETPTFGLLTEFPIYPPETRQARRIDALIAENYSVDAHVHDEVVLHGIEIKVSKSDLLHDEKMGDYALYVDKMWVAIPNEKEIVSAARDYIANDWGLLLVNIEWDDGFKTYRTSIDVDREAKQGNPIFRDRAMMTLARKLIQRSPSLS